MRRLFLTTAALWAVASPGAASAATVTFCGPKPIGQCGFAAPSSYYPGVEYGSDMFRLIGVQIISGRPLRVGYFDFTELQFKLAIINGNPLEFEISAGGRTKKERPKSAGVFEYSVESVRPINEVDVSIDYTPAIPQVFGVISDVRVSGPIPLSGAPMAAAMATPEASTWAMCLVGFGLLGLRGWRARNRPSICG